MSTVEILDVARRQLAGQKTMTCGGVRSETGVMASTLGMCPGAAEQVRIVRWF